MSLKSRVVLLLLLLIISSCTNKKELFYSDDLFIKLYETGFEDLGLEVKLFNKDELDLNRYQRIITTGFIYQQDTILQEYEGVIEILNFYGSVSKDSHVAIVPDYSDLLTVIDLELSTEIGDSKVGYIYDSRFNLKLPGNNNTFLEINNYTKKGDISSFIDSNSGVDFWIVLNKSYANYIYNKIIDKKKVFMEVDNLMNFDSNLVATVETDFKPYLIDNKPIDVYIKKR